MSRDGDRARAPENTPDREKLREGLRRAIVDALALEIDRTSARTVGRLAAAGALGVVGAVGAAGLFSGDLLGGGHAWRVAVCAAAWAGLLVACLTVVLLQIRIQRIPLTEGCALALVGIGLAAVLALLWPDPDRLAWWLSTPIGKLALDGGGRGAGAFSLGACSALLIGSVATLILALRKVAFHGAILPAGLLFLMLWPTAMLESAREPPWVFACGSAGLLAGAYAGLWIGAWPARRLRDRLSRRS